MSERIKQCIGLSGKPCTDFSTAVSQLCPNHEKELDERLKAIKESRNEQQAK